MVEPSTPSRELANLLEIFRLALAIHLVAEARVFTALIPLTRPPRALRLQITKLREEHLAQQRMGELLQRIQPGSDDWYTCALELRVLVLDHAKREDYLRATIDDHIPPPIRLGIAAQYATERMRMLATTSPLAIASYAA